MSRELGCREIGDVINGGSKFISLKSCLLYRANGRGGFGGRKPLLIPSGDHSRSPEKQTVGTVTASHEMPNLQALSSSLNAGTAKGGCLGRGEALGCPLAVCPPERPRPFTHYRCLTALCGHRPFLALFWHCSPFLEGPKSTLELLAGPLSSDFLGFASIPIRVVADVWEKDVWAPSRPSLGAQVLPSFPREIAVQKCLGKRLEVPDILLPDICGLLTHALVARTARPTSPAIWHRGRLHRKPNRSERPNLRHFESLDIECRYSASRAI